MWIKFILNKAVVIGSVSNFIKKHFIKLLDFDCYVCGNAPKEVDDKKMDEFGIHFYCIDKNTTQEHLNLIIENMVKSLLKNRRDKIQLLVDRVEMDMNLSSSVHVIIELAKNVPCWYEAVNFDSDELKKLANYYNSCLK